MSDYGPYSTVSDVKNVTVTTGWSKETRREVGVVTLVPDTDYPDTLGARWTVKRNGETLGTVRRHTWTPHVRTGRGGRLRRDLKERTGWNSTRPDGQVSMRHLDTRNAALLFLLEENQ